MLHTDFISAFNAVIPQHLIGKLRLLGLNNSLCNWMLDFLNKRLRSVRIKSKISSISTLSTAAFQGSVFIPLLFTPMTGQQCTVQTISSTK